RLALWFRFRSFARLRLQQRTAWLEHSWSVYRQIVSEQHRVARYSATQSELGKDSARFNSETASGASPGENFRYRCRRRPLRNRSDAGYGGDFDWCHALRL